MFAHTLLRKFINNKSFEKIVCSATLDLDRT